ncbi:MAG: hypothetical protein QM736_20855 [Vicinamibacterales bacterium]
MTASSKHRRMVVMAADRIERMEGESHAQLDSRAHAEAFANWR